MKTFRAHPTSIRVLFVTLIGLASLPTALSASKSNVTIQVVQNSTWVRRSPPGVPYTAGYLRLKNTASREVRLTGAQSPICRVVELHTHVHEAGSVHMKKIDAIPVGPGQEVELKPESLHLMFIDLKSDAFGSTSIPIHLQFSDGTSLDVLAELRDYGKDGHGHSPEPQTQKGNS